MENLNEYQLKINNDDDLEKWKSTWVPGTPVPAEVTNYVRAIVIPRLMHQAEKTLIRIDKLEKT